MTRAGGNAYNTVVHHTTTQHVWTILVLLTLLLAPTPAHGDDSVDVTTTRVAIPVADLRGRPSITRRTYSHDRHQESQLLYGEAVAVKRRRGTWSHVEAIEQPEWNHNRRWEGYPGWIRSRHLIDVQDWTPNLTVTGKHAIVLEQSDPHAPVLLTLSLGSRIVGVEPLVDEQSPWQPVRLLDGRSGWIPRALVMPMVELQQLPPDALRQRLIDTARLLLNDPYYWGGRSATPSQELRVIPAIHSLMAVDCSGLTNLCHRAVGIDVPRDAHEQFLRCRRLDKRELQPGDLVFLSAPDDPQQITHVMLYVGEDDVIEAPGTGKTVHQTTLRERVGFTLRGIREQKPVAERRFVHFGTYLP